MSDGKVQKLKQKLKKVKFIYIPYIRIKEWFLNREKVKNMQKSGSYVMKCVTEALNDTDIEAFCTFGTMLGFIRDGGFIKSDNDIDMGILKTDSFSWKKLEQILNKAGMKKIKYFTCEGEITEQTYICNHVTIDFFLYIPEGTEMSVNIYFRREGKSYSSNKEFELRRRKGVIVRNIRKVNVNGLEVLLPENSEEYLEETYGKSWKVPDPNYVADSKDKYTVPGKMGIIHWCK